MNRPFLVGIISVAIIVLWMIYIYKPSLLYDLIFTH